MHGSAFGAWAPTTMGAWNASTMGAWNVSTMGAWGAIPAFSPFPIEHPFWIMYGPNRKLSILDGKIFALRKKKQTTARQRRTIALVSLRTAIRAKVAAKASQGDTSDIDAELALLEGGMADETYVDDSYGPPAPAPQQQAYMPAPQQQQAYMPAASSGPSPMLLVGGALLLAGGTYLLMRPK